MRSIVILLVLALAQSGTKGVRLERIPAPEATAALGADSVVVIPLGLGLASHGAHLSLGTDLTLAEHLAHRVSEATSVAVAPALGYHANPLEADTARDVTVQIVRTLAAARPRRFYVINTSAEPASALKAAADALQREGVLLHSMDFAAQVGAHAAETETSIMLHIDPPAVNMSRARGAASRADAARGKVVLDALVERIVREIDALRRATPPAPRAEEPARAPLPSAPPPEEPRRPSGCTAGDERTIVDIANRFNGFWATADVDRMAALWSEAGDLVHPDGVVERGRTTIRLNRREQLARKEYRASKHLLTFGVIRCVSPDVAVADGKWTLTGVYDAAGNLLPRGEGLTTVVLKKQGGDWLFEAYRYTVTLAQATTKAPTLLKKPGYPDK